MLAWGMDSCALNARGANAGFMARRRRACGGRSERQLIGADPHDGAVLLVGALREPVSPARSWAKATGIDDAAAAGGPGNEEREDAGRSCRMLWCKRRRGASARDSLTTNSPSELLEPYRSSNHNPPTTRVNRVYRARVVHNG